MAIIKFKNKKFRIEVQDDVDRSVLGEIFKFQEYRVAEGEIVNARYPIFDVGAHIGAFSLYVRALNNSVSIVAFEPEPHNFDRLEKTVDDNQIENIQLEPLALANQTEKRQLIIAADSHNHKLSTSFMSGPQEKTIPVGAVSLKDYCEKSKIRRISLIKLDIEGGEFELVKNWDEASFKLFDALIMEFHDTPGQKHQELFEILKQHKFGVQIFPSQFDRKMGFIFARRKISIS